MVGTIWLDLGALNQGQQFSASNPGNIAMANPTTHICVVSYSRSSGSKTPKPETIET